MQNLVTKTLLIVGFSLLISFTCSAQKKMGKFGSSISTKIGPKTIRVPYSEVISYMDYAEPGSEDEIKKGKKFYYIYIWIPKVVPELGIRMISPVGDNVVKDAIQTEAYLANKDSKDYFDTYIRVEKSLIFKPEKVTAENIKSTTWLLLDHNDDSREMPPLPNRKKYNSLLRYKSEVGKPLAALAVGLYRIGFTSYKTGEVKGSFLAQVGSPMKLNGVVMAKSIDDLIEQINMEQ